MELFRDQCCRRRRIFDVHRPHADLSSGPCTTEGRQRAAILHLHPAAGPRLTPVIERLAQRHTVFIPAAPGFNGTPSMRRSSRCAALPD
jgi:hypothetical protein